ncbi:LOW QUALITY PROTEIN: hypothetical protein TorRG33x02_256180 [Trema orientale]|uniref:Ribosomal protein n=1 Tax=Trema orientale TaxID=63057 RepID=A0A2P5DBN5_TREOI|nr:LOW QUALITY PROTEIN: hypothetical protein TorRG33x02_256180 [Trema orientale]
MKKLNKITKKTKWYVHVNYQRRIRTELFSHKK